MVRQLTKSSMVAALAAAALTLTACSSGGDAAPEPAASGTVAPAGPGLPASMVGMHVEGVEVEAWPSAPFGSLRLWDNGTAWSQIELAKGEFKWDNLEGALANAESKGMTDILMVLGTTPEWAASDTSFENPYPPYPGANSAPKNIKDWEDWVTAVVTRFKGRISAYQIWNEASYKQFWNGTPEQMAELTKTAYDIIKANDPDALVVSASPALRLDAPFQKFYPAYLAALAKDGWPIDVLAFHTYPDANGDPAARGALIEVAKKAITDAGAPADMPLWDTELNYGLAGGDQPKVDITGPRAAGWVVRTYIDDLRYGIERSYWYIWTQKPYDLLGVQAFPGSDAEQGFFALENWIIGSTFNGCQENGNAVTCDFDRAGQKSVVAWAETGEAAYTAPEGAALVCDPIANCQETQAGAAITLTEIPVRIYLQ